MFVLKMARTNFDPPSPTREQVQNVLMVAWGGRHEGARPISTYEPLGWLLRDDLGNAGVRRTRRVLYRRLVGDLAREFDRIYSERLTASNGPWDFPQIYVASQRARKCIRRMRWYAFQHMLHLPGVSAGSVQVYDTMMELLAGSAPLIATDGSNIS